MKCGNKKWKWSNGFQVAASFIILIFLVFRSWGSEKKWDGKCGLVLGVTSGSILRSCDGDAALLCDGLCYKTKSLDDCGTCFFWVGEDKRNSGSNTSTHVHACLNRGRLSQSRLLLPLSFTSSSRIMPQRKTGRVAPLKKFSVPVVSWRPNSRQFKRFQENCRITYTAPEPIKIRGKDW